MVDLRASSEFCDSLCWVHTTFFLQNIYFRLKKRDISLCLQQAVLVADTKKKKSEGREQD